MGISDAVTVAVGSMKDLYGSFVNQIVGRGNANIDASTLHQPECWVSVPDNKTQMFLDPFEDHHCAGSDWIVLLMLACVVHAISWSGRWFIYEPLADARMKGKSPTWNVDARKKFGETMTCNVFFIISSFIGWRVIWPKHWSTSPTSWTATLDDWSLQADFKFFYLLYGGRFTSDLVSIFFEKRTRGAFLLAFAHHLVTIALVLLTATANFCEFAGVVMFHFDWADPFLLTAKACKYLSFEPDDSLNQASDLLFTIFAVVFIITRGFIYDYVVYVACRDGPQSLLGLGGKGLLIILACMQTYWIGLIIQAAIIKKKTGKLEDLQSKEKKAK